MLMEEGGQRPDGKKRKGYIDDGVDKVWERGQPGVNG